MALYHEDIIDIELNSGSIARSFINHTIGEGDDMANRFGVALYRDGEPVSAESRTVAGVFIAPDGNRYALTETSYPGSTGKSGNRAWVQLPSVCYNVEGQFSLVIKVSGSGVNGTMRIVDGNVSYTGESGAVVPTSTIPTTADLIAAYEDAIAVIDSSVRFDAEQSLTDAEKLQAQENIGAYYQPQIDGIKGEIGSTALPTTAQTITGAIAEHMYRTVSEIDDGLFEKGSISSQGDNDTFAQSCRARSMKLHAANDILISSKNVIGNANALLNIFEYNSANELIRNTGWISQYYVKAGTIFRILLTSNKTSSSESKTLSEILAYFMFSTVEQDHKLAGETIQLDCGNLLNASRKYVNEQLNGVLFAWSADGCNVSGTASATANNDLYNSKTVMPSGIVAGGLYNVYYASSKVNFAVYAYDSEENLTTLVSTKTNATFKVPAGTVGMIIRLNVPNGTSSISETVSPMVTNILSSKALQELVQINYGLGVDQFPSKDADDINLNSVIFVSSNGGVANFDHVPFAPCWVMSYGNGKNFSSLAMEIAVPYLDGNKPEFRIKRAGTWSNWISFGGGGTTTIVQEVSRDTYNNTYEINVSPTITTDSNGWLQPVDTDTSDETGKTDMTSAIMAMLNSNGYCHLAPGIFYVSGSIDIPERATLEGSGNQTIVRLLQSVSSGYICRVKRFSTVKDIRFSGGYGQGDIPSSPNIGGRNGIIFIGNRDGEDPDVTPSTTLCNQISNCWFEHLDSAIYGYNAGGGLQEGLLVSDCYIARCTVGINIDYWSEYCKFTNVVTFQCYYGCINNGGNNVFTSCTFHGVVGFLIDNSGDNKPNNAHGSVIGCTFNHIDNMDESHPLGGGVAIKILSATTNGFVFTGCQFWYSTVYVEDSPGIQLSNCEFGGGTPKIETIGDDPIFITGCTFKAAPTLVLDTPAVIDASYTYAGQAITN